ncbi:SDR family NAD(P)-dependent oxidoreductase [Azoarcus indigens]|uniref:3-hydroxybutyrate dehydrogenase/3-oxoacyl-[acyl-carrier protein] reductase n=1 Tax=Azoarcus indigens TaxID=29545 RepID=A0A4R6DJW6_9RHOO|nr:SDR family NAD(P)-dependent oxidoreductase [Azoarcus indigens]TDN44973.1 3-hydroxybutyrate dehydrogenase/3-oxoacyl-[acyl-carrier protein] reductase [Azoarcus indigens]
MDDIVFGGMNGGGQIALVTGASSGTGADLALALAVDGYHVALLGRRAEALKEVAERVKQLGSAACTLVCDLQDEEAVAASMKTFLKWSGDRIDLLVNVAGIPGPVGVPVGELAVTDFDAVMATNLRGPFLTMSHLLPVMCKLGRGRVINIGGNHGMRGRAGRSSYSASKWALRGLTRSAALEVGRYGVTVNYIAPGPIAVDRMRAGWEKRAEDEGVDVQTSIDRYITEMGAVLRRPSETADVVEMVRFLAGDGGRNITGQELVVDGGVIV